MPDSSRTVYGRAFAVTPLWLWWLQRLSALALGPLVLLHVAAPALASNRAWLALLLVVTAAHGYSGLRRYGSAAPRTHAATVIALAWLAAVALIGGWIVVAA